MKCSDRILAALKFYAKTPTQLSDELFVHQLDVRVHLAFLLRSGEVFRKFSHNVNTGRPDYIYSSARFPVPYSRADDRDLIRIVGDWDSMDIRAVNQ